MRRNARAGVLLALVVVVVAACGGSSGGSGNNPTLTIAKTGAANGDNQIATVGTALPNNLRVIVTDDGTPQEGEVVSWATANGSVVPTQSTTDVNGVATTAWTIGTTAGNQSMTASLTGAIGSPVTFAATGNAGPAASVVPTSGNGQFGVVSTAFAQGITAKVSDQFGNGILGAVVTWTVTSGTATTAAGNSVTNNQGIASMTVTAGGTPGPVAISASVAAVAATADFDLTVVPAARQVDVGSNFFTSLGNASSNPAVDTVVVGQKVQWNLVGGNHTVRSTGTPAFTSSSTLTGAGYTVQFLTAGTYNYNCAVHGNQMTGSVVVQ